MYTFQDFQETVKTAGVLQAVQKSIMQHKTTELYRNALIADKYDQQRNVTISNYQRMLYTMGGRQISDPTASNAKLCSNFFRRLNTQRSTYSLGNGLTFPEDNVKEMLGVDFDNRMMNAGYNALIHGVSFLFWNVDHVHVFPVTQFAPLWDEENGTLRAGVRFWQVDYNKPVIAILYEEDGYTRFKGGKNCTAFKVTESKRAYRINYVTVPAESEPEVVGEENYSVLPIVPLWGSRLHQSTLVGMRSKIDAYDLIASGLANDFQDCACIYWIVSGAGGMDNSDLAQFRDRLKLNHIAAITDRDEANITPYTQDIPTANRTACLQELRSGIYEDFGALDCTGISAAAKTATEINAAYQPMDENADDYEYQIIEAVQQLLHLLDIESTPQFKRNRISNLTEQTNMILNSANYLDEETVLKKLPFLTPDEIDEIMYRKAEEDSVRTINIGYGSQEEETEE